MDLADVLSFERGVGARPGQLAADASLELTLWRAGQFAALPAPALQHHRRIQLALLAPAHPHIKFDPGDLLAAV